MDAADWTAAGGTARRTKFLRGLKTTKVDGKEVWTTRPVTGAVMNIAIVGEVVIRKTNTAMLEGNAASGLPMLCPPMSCGCTRKILCSMRQG